MVRIALSLLFALAPSPARAWNALGHKVIAEIAWQQITPAARQSIVDTLRRHPRFDDDFAKRMPADVEGANKATQDRWIFQHAATWPDIARGIRGDERQTYNRPTWHYVTYPLFLDARDRQALEPRLTVNVSAEYPTSIDASEYNVLQAIQHSQAPLESDQADTATRAVAICWLFHLVGDCHQPLHSTALFSVDQFPTGDRGGNLIPLTRGRNLHALWDNLLGRSHRMSNVRRIVAELSDRDRSGDVSDSAGQETDVRKWVAESHELAKSFAYDPAILRAVRSTAAGANLAPMTLDDDYLKTAGKHARRRIVAAGVRLSTACSSLGRQP